MYILKSWKQIKLFRIFLNHLFWGLIEKISIFLYAHSNVSKEIWKLTFGKTEHISLFYRS